MHSLQQLTTFITVVEENGFTQAGRKLGLTNAAVSKQIAKLESTLKAELLKRTTRHISLTESGLIFLEHAKKIAQELRELENAFSGMRKAPSGHLRVGSSTYFSNYFLIPHLPEFFRLYPNVTVDILTIERILDLFKEGVDINMGHSYVGGPDDIHRKLGETRYAYLASPAYLKQFGTPEKPSDLLKHRYITHSARRQEKILTFKNNVKITLDPFMRINDSKVMIECALQGLGIVKLHRYIVKDDLDNGKLVEVLKGYDESVQPIYLCYQPHRILPPKIRCFVDFICSKINKEVF
ncbi:LysR family transcriptional regulator [Estrella lausannensis]|uniref:Transcriptional regulator n=1 Tax=Estrella lausannensis TaxID=483423 RepID=A0A0H5DRJ8_9BACT|nr:LysR family transcriptional regulator [Estrella lausannensis]CRX39217.1 Transcriptional regulator [Estrella lausannensis]